MSLTLALTNTLSALKVNQDALAVISQNIANANSENYTRRTISQEASVVGGQLSGAQISSVQRAVDSFVLNSARRQAPAVGEAQVKTEYYDRLQASLGTPGAGNSLNSYIDDFFASLSDLSASTEQNYLRTAAVDSGVKLASEVKRTADFVQNTRYEIDREISTTLNTINSTLETLQSINKRIANAEVAGSDKNALFDQRDTALTTLASLIDADQTINADGSVTIFLARGELLNSNNRFKLEYTPARSVQTFNNEDTLSAITVTMLDADTNLPTDSQYTLVSASNDPNPVNNFTSGKLKGLVELRDNDLPKILDSLDNLARNITDAFNAVQNDGAGFPPASTLTGTRAVTLGTERYYSGKMMIAVLDKTTGAPITNPYVAATSDAKINPLIIDFDRFQNGLEPNATLTVQNIITEINEYYGAPSTNRVDLSGLQDIKLAQVSNTINSTEASGNLVFTNNVAAGDTVSIGGTTYTFIATGTPSFGTNIEVKPTLSQSMAEVIRYLGTIPTAPTNTVSITTLGNNLNFTAKTSGTGGNAITVGATAAIGVSYNGGAVAAAAGGNLTGGVDPNGVAEFDLEFMNVLDRNVSVRVLSTAIDGGAAGAVTVLPAGFGPYTAEPGLRQRTSWDGTNNGKIQIDFTGSTFQEGQNHTVTMQVEVTDAFTGAVTTETIQFKVPIPDPNVDSSGYRYDAAAISGVENGTLTTVVNNNFLIRAELVDKNGKVITEPNITTEGYLRLRTSDGTLYGIAIDEMDGKELGDPNARIQADSATNFGVSHYFGLNDFFTTGSTETKNSAINMKVRDEYRTDTSRLATAGLSKSNQTADPTDDLVYTYEIGRGSNQNITALANVRFQQITFKAAGDIPPTTMNLNNYAAEIITYTSGAGNSFKQQFDEEKLIFDGFNDKIKATGGVNLDEELANTVIFQNNYSAAARIIRVVDDLFKDLINAF